MIRIAWYLYSRCTQPPPRLLLTARQENHPCLYYMQDIPNLFAKKQNLPQAGRLCV